MPINDLYCILGEGSPDLVWDRRLHFPACWNIADINPWKATQTDKESSLHEEPEFYRYRIFVSFSMLSLELTTQTNRRTGFHTTSWSQWYLDIFTSIKLLVPAKIHWFGEEGHNIRIERLPVRVLQMIFLALKNRISCNTYKVRTGQ